MHAENFFINNSCDWETVEAISEGFPEFDVVSSLAFFIESVDSVDAGTLMVSSQEEEIFWILDLIGEEQSDSFQRLFTSINIISQEKVVSFRWVLSVFEKSQKIEVLSMNITTNLQWCLKFQ